MRLDVPASLPGGLHLADAIVRDGLNRVMAWGSAAFTTPGAVAIESVTFDKRAYYGGEVANATVKLKAPDAQPGQVVLKAELTDGIGRLLSRAEKSADVSGETPVVLEVPVGRPVVNEATLRVTAEVGGKSAAVVEQSVVTFPEKFANRSWSDYCLQIWGSAAGSYRRPYLVPLRARRLRDFGVSTVLASPRWRNEREYEDQVREGFQLMPMGVSFGFISVGHRVPKGKMTFGEQRTMYQRTKEKKYLERPICLNDPEELAPLGEKLRRTAEYAGWLEPIGYNLGDEMSTTYYVTPFDYDFGPAALDTFREWAKAKYGTLEALNAQWGTRFAAWDRVIPMTAEEVRDRGNYSPWADHREFMDWSFCRFFEFVRSELRKVDPKASVGMSGSQAAEAYGGYNWRRLARALDFVQNYTHQNTIIMQRSFGPDLPRAPWTGYGLRNPGLRRTLWWRLLNGNFGSAYFSTGSIFMPDMRYGPTVEEMAPIVREFQGGVAGLLKRCKRVSEIGLHYSHASIRGAYITGAAGLFRENRNGWIRCLEDAGFQCEFLATPELESGELAKRGYAAFVLPYSVALSEKEARALREYVQDGGLLIADGRMGMMDVNGKTLNRARLEDLFGVGRDKVDPRATLRDGSVRFASDLDACRVSGIAYDVNVAEADLQARAGKPLGAHGSSPAGIVHKSGKGATVYLNLFMDAFPRRRNLGIQAPIQRLVENLLRIGNVRPAVQVTVDAEPAPAMFTVRYTNGDALYVASCMDLAKGKVADWSAPVTMKFPKTGNVYDLRSGKALGPADEAKTDILNGDAALYAVMPYRIESVAVKPERSRVRGGESVGYAVTLASDHGAPGLHIVNIEVSDPEGKIRKHYGASLAAQQGKARGSFDLALNDTPGRWTLRVTDFVTRTTGTSVVEVTR